jgi:hypothetical protein
MRATASWRGAGVRRAVDPALESRVLQDSRSAVASHRGYRSRDVHHAGWVATSHAPENQIFNGQTLYRAPAWTLTWPTDPELGVAPFRG